MFLGRPKKKLLYLQRLMVIIFYSIKKEVRKEVRKDEIN